MSGPQQILLASTAAGADPYWSQVSLLLDGVGSNGSTTILDTSQYAHTVSIVGSLVNISTTTPPTGMSSSIQSQGVGGLTVPDHSSFDLGSGDFTSELFFYQLTINVFPVLFRKATAPNFSPFEMLLSSSRELFGRSSNNNSTFDASVVSGTSAYSANAWNHLAWVRSGTTFTLWLNGASIGTDTMSGAVTANSDPVAVMTSGSANYFNGRVSAVRLTKGTNRYPSAFTPPSLPLPNS